MPDEVIFTGVVDPSRLDDLAAVFTGLNVRYSIELWTEQAGVCLTQLHALLERLPSVDSAARRAADREAVYPHTNHHDREGPAALTAETGGTAARVVVIGLGGTIAMTKDGAGGVTPTLSTRQLLDAVPGLADTGVHVEAHTFRTRPGACLTFDDLTQLAALVPKHFDAGAAGVVITQGTDTIEESAYLLDLLHPGPQPIVVTGAMRNPTLAGADGPANLLAAVEVAASPAVRGLGALVVMADEIHAARRVRKTHSTSVATFASPNGGPLGYVVEGAVSILNRPADRFSLPAPRNRAAAPRVALHTATLDDDGSLLAAVAGQADALVVAGFGVGHVPERWLPALTEAARRVPVVLASRTGGGPVLTSTYGFPGGERDLIGRGLIPAGFLDPYKARILLRLALAAGADHDQIRSAVTTAGGVAPPASWPWPGHDPAPPHRSAGDG